MALEPTHENLSRRPRGRADPSVRRRAQAPPTAAETVAGSAVIPRSALFGNPEKTQARLSPDGKYVSFIAPSDGVLNVWLGPSAAIPTPPSPLPTITSAASASTSGRTTTNTCCTSRTKAATRTCTSTRSTWSPAHQKDLTPYKGVAGAGHGPVVEEARRHWPLASTTACPNGTIFTKWISTPASACWSCRTRRSSAGYNLDFDLKPRSRRRTMPKAASSSAASATSGSACCKFGQADSLTSGRHRHRSSRAHRAAAILGGPRQVRAGARGSRHRQDHGD